MIYQDRFICNICGADIKRETNVAYTDNGNHISGEFCICEFCYLNLRPAW